MKPEFPFYRELIHFVGRRNRRRLFAPTTVAWGGSCLAVFAFLFLSTPGYSQTTNLTWEPVMPSAPWSARYGLATAVFKGKLWVLGGGNNDGAVNDIYWTANGTDWTTVPLVLPRWSGRMGAGCLVYSNQLWIIGGAGKGGGTGNNVKDVWCSSDGTNWVEITSDAKWSPARAWFGSVVYSNRMLVLGGHVGTATPTKEIYASTNGAIWELVNANPQWDQRTGFGCTAHEGRLWILGGTPGNNTALRDVWWSVDGVSNWSNATYTATWPQRYYHQSCSIDGRLWVLGGYVPNSPQNDVWQSANGTNWQQVTSPLVWSARWGHGLAVYRDRIWVLSGTSANNDIWRSSPFPVTVAGTITYPGPLVGKIFVTASGATTNRTVEATASNTFSIGGLPASQPYSLTAFLDANTNQIQDAFEASGTYPANPVVVSTTDALITLTNSPADSDSDGLPDYWEFAYFGSTTNASSYADADSDGLTNVEEYQLGTSPANRDSDSDEIWDGDEARKYFTNPLVPNPWAGAKPQTQYYYDKTDRLTAAEYSRGSNGFSIVYVYDGNGNILRQKTLARDANGNGLPDVWEFQNGLTNNASAFADSDGDGWSDYQELKGGSLPRDASSVPLNPPQTKPLAVVLANPGTLTSLGYVALRLWDAEGNASTPFFSYQAIGTNNWQTATIVTLDGATYSTNSLAAAPPSGTNHTIVWNALADLGPNVVTNILLRARAQDASLMGDWSAGTLFTVNTTLPPPVDGDGDGMPDSWEIEFFGNTFRNGVADWDDDGANDLAEYLADTNPTNSVSFLRITTMSMVPAGLMVGWSGGNAATQYLQRNLIIGDTNSSWLNVWTSLPPTPISGSYTDSVGTNVMQFYRIEAARP